MDIRFSIIFGFALLLFELQACKTKDEGLPEEQMVDHISINNGKPSILALSEITDSLVLIPLETTQESIIGRVNRLKIIGSRIYILDKRLTKDIKVFSLKGKFLFKIDRIGHGPGEFTEPAGFCVNSNGEIAVTDFSGKKVLFFDNKGNFIRNVYTDFFPNDIELLPSGKYAITSYRPSDRVVIMDETGNILTTEIESFPGLSRYYTDEISQGVNNPLFREVFCDSIYSISERGVQLKYVIEHNEYSLTRSKYMSFPIQTKNGITSRSIPEGYRYGTSRLLESKKFLSFYYKESGLLKEYWCIYDRNNQISYTFDVSGKSDDLLYSHISPKVLTSYNNFFCYLIDSYSLVKNRENNRGKSNYINIKYINNVNPIINSLKVDSNPILVMFTVSLTNKSKL